jgi:hypothetical protein
LPQCGQGLPRPLVLGIGAGERCFYFQRSGGQPQEQLPAPDQERPEGQPCRLGPLNPLVQGGDLRPEGAVVDPRRRHPLAQGELGGPEGTP